MTGRAALYARVSTDKQDELLQVPRLIEYAQRYEFEVVDVFQDQCSGATDNRPAWQRILALCQEGKIDYVIAVKLDRIMRSMINMETTVNLFKQWGVSLITLDLGDLSLDTPANNMFRRMVAIYAQYEREMISQRTKEALQVKKDQGVKLGRPTSPPPDLRACAILRKQGYGWKKIAVAVGVSKHTLDKYRAEIEKIVEELPNHTAIET